MSKLRDIVIIGAGGHARVVLDAVQALDDQFRVVAMTDPDPALRGTTVFGVAVAGDDSVLPGLHRAGASHAIIALGENALRDRVAARVEAEGFELATVIHPAAVVSRHATVAAGTIIMAGAVVQAGTRIGQNVIVNTSASIDHDCLIEDAVHIAPGTQLGGGIHVGRGALVGIGSTVLPGGRIGAHAIVGGGGVVVREVAPGATVVGVPARERR